MTEQVKATDSQDDKASSVTFHYVKSSQFRVLHCDGIAGGLTPNGHIHFAVFSERPAIPQQITHKITQANTLGEAIAVQGRSGIIRDMEIDVLCTVETAEQLSSGWKLRLRS